ncbi:MAG TPA: hypothetical protein VKE22_07410 [Haliangiales bacterium]|nr:hypothetical protein [Haliangiales bacterium]
MSKRVALPVLVAAFLAASSGCATTTFQSTWRAPNARPLQIAGKKVVGLFVGINPTLRRIAEDSMAREISARGAQGVPAYTVLSDDEIKDRDQSKAKLEQLGFSGVVVMRIVGRETQYRYEPGYWYGYPYYRRFWGGYWGWGWGRVYEPGYLTVDRIVSVETLVYSFEQDELVWAGISRTLDPARLDAFVAELAQAVSDQMVRDGLLPPR